MINISSPQPSKSIGLEKFAPEVKVSPVKIPAGAKQIGNYILGKTIGSGSFGKVHLGLHIPTGEKVAVKIIDKLKLNSRDLERVQREIKIMKAMLHPSVIQLYQIIQTQKSLLLILEYMQNGELFNYIIQNKKLSQKDACEIFHQIIEAIDYIHKMGVAHRDLKPQNILLDFNNKVKIIDFGLSNQYQLGHKLKTQCGSPCYAAPQMVLGTHRYDPLKIDIWSAGITLFAMICGYLPFCDHDTQQLYKKILSGSYKFPQSISAEAKQLISMILVTNPKERATLSDIKSHKWYRMIKQQRYEGIDTRFYKIPFENFIVTKMFPNEQVRSHAIFKLEQNGKTKQTATYYLIAKKLTKQGHKLPTFFGSKYFESSYLRPLTQDQDSGTTIVERLDAIEVIAPIQKVEEDPVTNGADLECFTMKSAKFQQILKQFFIQEPSKNTEEQVKLKGMFYAFNLDNQKKRKSLKQKTAKQKATALFCLKKGHRISTQMKLGTHKKSIIDVLHSMNNNTTCQSSKSRRIKTQKSHNQSYHTKNSQKKEQIPRLPSLFKDH